MRTVLILAFCGLFILSAHAQRVKGEGPVVSRDFDLASFEKVTLSTSGKLILTQGSPQSIRIEGQANILDLIRTEVRDDHWKIGFTENVGNHKEVVVYATLPKLSYVKLSGSGDILGENQFNQSDEFYVGISGSGNVKMDLKATNLASKISGSGNIKLEGQATNFDLKISGSGDVRAYDLEALNTQISISGSGDCEVHTTGNLKARIVGSGDIYYRGSPQVQTKVSGSGNIVSRGDGGR
jgi:hypothetical protein